MQSMNGLSLKINDICSHKRECEKEFVMRIMKGFALAAMILVSVSMFTSCETVAAGIYDGVKAWQEDPDNPLNNNTQK